MMIDPSVTPPKDISRPPRKLVGGLAAMGSATASGELSRLGLRDPHLTGLAAVQAGHAVAGPALTLQFMPKREDVAPGEEYADPREADPPARLLPRSGGRHRGRERARRRVVGVFGEMMMTYMKGRGGAG